MKLVPYARDTLSSPKLRYLKGLLFVFGISYTGLLAYYTLRIPFTRRKLTVIFLGVVLIGFYIIKIIKLTERRAEGEIDRRRYIGLMGVFLLFTGIAILVTTYTFREFEALTTVRIGFSNDTDVLVGAGVLLLVIHATFDQYGKLFGSVLMFALFYALFGQLFPGIFHHSGYELNRVITMTTLGLEGGVFGESISGIIATWITAFLIFAGFSTGFGGLKWIQNCGKYVSQYIRSGPVQTAIFSSMGFGMISGSGAANTAITGSFTIPLMKDSQNISGEQAAAIESIASAGGQLMPPIMGAAAFLMADLLAIPLSTIIVVAIVPGFIYFFVLSVLGHQIGITSGQANKLDVDITIRDLMYEGVPHYISVIVLVYMLVEMRLQVLNAAMYSSLLIIVLAILKLVVDLGVNMKFLKSAGKSFVIGHYDAYETIINIGIIGAAIGAIVEIIIQTGVAAQVGLLLLDFAGESLIILLILTMILSIILGLGAPTVAAYLIASIILASSLIEIGVPELQAHFFIFYFAVLSYITPPIAISVAIASNIADSNFLRSAAYAMYIATPIYLLPYTFIHYDLIPAEGSGIDLFLLIRGLIVFLILCTFAYILPSDKRRSVKVGGILIGMILLVGIPFVGPSLLFG
jgi:TRAP transporter 4TM/12TM fusion protein